MSNTEIKEILANAFEHTKQNQLAKAQTLLETAVEKFPADISLWRALSITFQKQDAMPDAIAALDQLITIDKADIRAWVMKGALHENTKNFREALQAYHCALALNGENPSHHQGEIAQVQKRIPIVMGEIEARLDSKLAEAGLKTDKTDRRFNAAVDIMFGRKQIYFQQPHHLYFPELPHRQFYASEEFDWVPELEAKWPDIRKELETLLTDDRLFAPYLQSEDHIPGSDGMALANSMDWSSFYLIKDGVDVPENQSRCPQTTKAIRKVNLCRTGGGTPSVLFSRLKPGAHIPPHTGMLNMRLICHLPIIVPGKSKLRVGNETHEWVEGKVVVFDDTIEHEAWNHANDDRFVLLFDIWRPEITERERTLLDIVISAR